MNTKLSSGVTYLLEKMGGDDFVKLSIAVDGKRAQVLPLWERTAFRYQQEGGKAAEVPSDALPEFFASHLAGANEIVLDCELRGSRIILTCQGGKVSLKTHGKQAERTQHVGYVEAGTRQTFIKAGRASKMLKAIGIMSADGEIKGDKRRKYYQVDRFVELLSHMLQEWPAGEELVVLDSGCGKSYLSFALNYYLHEVLGKKCFFLGVDSDEEVIKSSRSIQQELNYRNMDFSVEDLASYVPKKRPDMVLSLHACDTATDLAIALGLRLQSKYIIAVPCCQAALTEEINYGALGEIARHPVLRLRLADTMTDGLRVLALEAKGYKVSVVEYVSPLDTPKNIMIRAEKVARLHSEKLKAYEALKQALKVKPWIDRLER